MSSGPQDCVPTRRVIALSAVSGRRSGERFRSSPGLPQKTDGDGDGDEQEDGGRRRFGGDVRVTPLPHGRRVGGGGDPGSRGVADASHHDQTRHEEKARHVEEV